MHGTRHSDRDRPARWAGSLGILVLSIAAVSIFVTTIRAATTAIESGPAWLVIAGCALVGGAILLLPGRPWRQRRDEPATTRLTTLRLVSGSPYGRTDPCGDAPGENAARHGRLVHSLADRALRDVRHHYEIERAFDFLGNTEDAVCVVDDAQRIVLWNAAACRMLGFEANDVLGRSCFDVLGGCDGRGTTVCRWRCRLREGLDRGEPAATRDLLVRTARGGRVRVNATTIGFRSGWLAHLLRAR